jgi:hypothetical protein
MTLPVKRRVEKLLGPLFDPLYFFYLLVDDFKSWRYFIKWFSSFRAGRSLVGEAKPWIPFAAANWLHHYLNRNRTVFEWGSGGSTIFLSERAGKVFSIEHDKKWHTLVSKVLAQRGITNCSYYLREPKPIVGTFSALESESSRFIYDDHYPGTTLHDRHSVDCWAIGFSPAGVGVSENLDDALRNLFVRFVERYSSNSESTPRDDDEVWRVYRTPLERRHVAGYLTPKRIVAPNYDYEFQHSWKNEAWRVYEPVSFDLLEATSILDKANRWVGRATSLFDSRDKFKMYLLLGEPRTPV